MKATRTSKVFSGGFTCEVSFTDAKSTLWLKICLSRVVFDKAAHFSLQTFGFVKRSVCSFLFSEELCKGKNVTEERFSELDESLCNVALNIAEMKITWFDTEQESSVKRQFSFSFCCNLGLVMDGRLVWGEPSLSADWQVRKVSYEDDSCSEDEWNADSEQCCSTYCTHIEISVRSAVISRKELPLAPSRSGQAEPVVLWSLLTWCQM